MSCCSCGARGLLCFPPAVEFSLGGLRALLRHGNQPTRKTSQLLKSINGMKTKERKEQTNQRERQSVWWNQIDGADWFGLWLEPGAPRQRGAEPINSTNKQPIHQHKDKKLSFVGLMELLCLVDCWLRSWIPFHQLFWFGSIPITPKQRVDSIPMFTIQRLL